MIRLIVFLILCSVSVQVNAQVKFVNRFEIESDLYDPGFQMSPLPDGIVSFRTIPEKALSFKRVFQYFVSDFKLNTKGGLVEFPVKEGFDMLGFDTDGNQLFVLFQKGYSLSSEKYILNIDLDSQKGFEFNADNLLEMDLIEFLVVNRKVLFLGNTDGRPVIQIYDLDNKDLYTVQGIYNNDTQVLQIKKLPELQAMEVVLSRKTPYREREVSINTYDFFGNLIREIKVDNFGDEDQEILDALLVQKADYQSAMIGAFGKEKSDSYQGMYIMEINEFGEYEFKLYTLADFPNFYNYLGEKPKERKDIEVEKNLEKGKIPSIRNYYAIRDIQQTPDAYYIYFDQFSINNSRGSSSLYSPTSGYRNNGWSRTGYDPNFREFITSNGGSRPPTIYQVIPEYQYVSAHFSKIAKTGQVIWDNAATYDGLITTYPEAFGEVAVVGDEYYHMYVRDLLIKLSYFKNGEKVFEHLDFEIELMDENERIVETNPSSLRLVHWYDRYYLLSGTQKIRFLKPSGGQDTREVYFLTKVLVNGDLYMPEGPSD
ncbi:MAG: transcriptional regulator [Algoriphagus sp.]|uniref:transcriptional regulator n=1 Tax=Algoriphagus sp. TaxID=1872435 RepID=UPI002634763D|nr:transcriptional regulator [Algoriphagus sp.]MDG1278422.1 transcriptional regulator [Algoriphagus sp.]